MKGKLIKQEKEYYALYNNEGIFISDVNGGSVANKLSIKNCQAIELIGVQQTEWEVEIEMICPHPEDTYVCGMQYGCDEDGCNNPNQVPYLDSDGCLILRRLDK